MTSRVTGLAVTLLIVSAVPGLAQGAQIRKSQVAIDVGVLELGISYAHRIGQGPWSLGGGVWGAWEPWSSFEQNVFEPLGAELFVRVQPVDAVQFELGPSLLQYRWADDCGECTGTFAGARAAAMVGQGVFRLGPTARFGVVSGGPSGNESGLRWGIQARLLFSWGD
jgi:hypothetical protein